MKVKPIYWCFVQNRIQNIPMSQISAKQFRLNMAKFLGIWIYDDLQWDKHIPHISCKIYSGSYAIKSAKRNLAIYNYNLKLYYCLVHSHLTHGITLWGSAYHYKLNKIERKLARNDISVMFLVILIVHHSLTKLNILKLLEMYKWPQCGISTPDLNCPDHL